MRMLAIGLVALVLLFYLAPGIRTSRRSRATNRYLRSAGASYSQGRSIHPHDPPRLSTTFWFIMVACVLLLIKLAVDR